MKIHTKHFDGTTFGMTANSSSQSKRNFKKCIYYKEMQPKDHIRKRYPCIRAKVLIPVMGMGSWMVTEKYIKTVQVDDSPELYVIYQEEKQ